MLSELLVIEHLARLLLSRRAGHADEGGYSTEAVIVTALLVALAIAAVGIIATKVLAKANSIETG